MDGQEAWRRRYESLRPAWRPSTEIYARLADERIDRETRVLDVGCGHAELLRECLSRARTSCGIELDVDALRRNDVARLKAVADAERIPFRGSSFDLVVLAWVLEHLERPERVFAEIHRVLRPGGAVVFLTPNTWNYVVWLIRAVPHAFHEFFTTRLYGRGEHDTFPTRYRMNSPARIERLLGGLGFRRERLVLNGDPSYLGVNAPLFRLACGIERLLDLPSLRRARVHIVGVYARPPSLTDRP